MKLFVSEGNPHCLKVLAALEVTGARCQVLYVNHEGGESMASLTLLTVNMRVFKFNNEKSNDKIIICTFMTF